MSNSINRSEFLRQLETVRAGLSVKESFLQSSCFVFKNGKVMTFNNEVACRAPTSLDSSIYGAVKAQPVLSILEKLPEDTIEIAVDNGQFLIYGERRNVAKIRMEDEVRLEINTVEKPVDEWLPLPEDFADAIAMVQECAKVHDEHKFVLMCVHIHPKWIEANDNAQLARYLIKTGVRQPTLVKREAIRHVSFLGMTEITETPSWLHFRNPSGTIMSCRRYIENFPDLAGKPGKGLNAKGEPAVLPKGLIEACSIADTFSKENIDNNRILIRLRPGEMQVKGESASGSYMEPKKLKYNGPSISFLISPKLLTELIKKHIECEIAPDALKVTAGKLTYVAWLYNPDEVAKNAPVKQEEE